MKNQRQCWSIFVHPVGGPGYGSYTEGTRAEAEATAKLRAGTSGTYTIKQVPAYKGTPTRTHARPA